MAALDFSADQAVIDNLEQVTVTSTRAAGNATAAVPDASIDWVTLREAQASNGAYRHGDAKFTLRAAAVSALGGVKPADTITRPDGRVWTVLAVTPPGIEGVWNATARDVSLAEDLRQLGTLARPVSGRDGAGRPLPSGYTVIAADVPCRVQPEGGAAGDVDQRRTLPLRYTAFVGAQLAPRARDRFEVAGTAYTVVEWRDPERIGDLMRLTLELVR